MYSCSEHINEPYFRNLIKEKGERRKCDFCSKTKKAISVDEIAEIITEGINFLFDDPADSLALDKNGEHGFLGNTFDFYDLWHDNHLGLEIENKLSHELYVILQNEKLYCDKNEYGSDLEFFMSAWENFKEIVKHKARYVFYFHNKFSDFNGAEPINILNKVQEVICNLDLISTLKTNSRLYRCRQHKYKDEIESATDLASPPIDKAKTNGRMNAAGISMFYCSKNKQLTIDEVINRDDKERPYYSTGIFRNIEELRLVDFSYVPKKSSVFDTANNIHNDTIDFLNEFIQEISKPISQSDTMTSYIPTQIVTEYIKFNPQINADGIIYPSSMDAEKYNIVLFYDHTESLENLNFACSSIKTCTT